MRFSFSIALLAVPFALTVHLSAQTPSAPHKATCKINLSPGSEADIAYYRGDLAKALSLYAEELKADPSNSRDKAHQISALTDQGKVDEANQQLDAWVASAPRDSYAATAASKIHFNSGDMLGAYALALKAIELDPCNADAYEEAAHFESIAGYHVTARQHYSLAHQLEPNNEHIHLDWISILNETSSSPEVQQFLANTKLLDDKKRLLYQQGLRQEQFSAEDSCELASVKGPAVIPMTPVYGAGTDVNYYGLEVSLNGHKHVLQIDTGASGLILTQSASNIGMKDDFKLQMRGFGGQGPTDTKTGYVDSLRIGGLEFHGCVVSVLSNFGVLGGSHIQGDKMDNIEGIIGTYLFSRYLVTLDYVHHEIRLDPLPKTPGSPSSDNFDALGGDTSPTPLEGNRYIAPSMKDWTSIYRSFHHLYVPTNINGKPAGLFLIDTGSIMNLIDKKLASRFTKTAESSTLIRGLSGVGRVGESGSFTVDFARLRLPVEGMNVMNFSPGDGVVGVLGYPTLKQLILHIDYRDNLVLFEDPEGKKL